MAKPPNNREPRANSRMRNHGGATELKILDTSERLFAESGYSAVPLRRICKEADVNLASVNYYFGSKLGLLRAVLHRRAEPINTDRKARLEDCLKRLPSGDVNVEEVVRAFIEPTMRDEAGSSYRKIRGHVFTNPDPTIRALVDDEYFEVARMFLEIMKQVAPSMDEKEFMWRIACVYGAMLFVPTDNPWLPKLLGSDHDLTSVEDAMKYALPFLKAGMSAPLSE
jgi:AcrR family transcriptional regulator